MLHVGLQFHLINQATSAHEKVCLIRRCHFYSTLIRLVTLKINATQQNQKINDCFSQINATMSPCNNLTVPWPRQPHGSKELGEGPAQPSRFSLHVQRFELFRNGTRFTSLILASTSTEHPLAKRPRTWQGESTYNRISSKPGLRG